MPVVATNTEITPARDAKAASPRSQRPDKGGAAARGDNERTRSMSLAQWDKDVRPHLHFIENGAAMAARHARALPVKTSFFSYAQDELAEARKVLESALANIITAQASYEDKPTEAPHAA